MLSVLPPIQNVDSSSYLGPAWFPRVRIGAKRGVCDI